MTGDDRIDHMLERLRPRVGASTELDPSRPAARELRTQITRLEQEDTMPMTPRTRRLLVAAPIAAAVAVGGVAATVLLAPADPETPGSGIAPPPAEAAVLETDTEDGLVVARVLDPTADSERYAAEFAEYGLEVNLRFVAASPTVVGNLVYMDSDLYDELDDGEDPGVEVVESEGECVFANGGCPVGVSIPVDHPGHVELVFGREPEPGEPYSSTNLANAPGEALEGLTIEGLTVDEARAAVAERDQEVTEYRIMTSDGSAWGLSDEEADALAAAEQAGEEADWPVPGEDDVDGSWIVEGVVLYAPGEVLLFVEEPEV